MGEENIIRGNFGRGSGKPAEAATYRTPDINEMTPSQRINFVVEQIRGWEKLIESGELSPELINAYKDSISNLLDLLKQDEQEEVLRLLETT
jgi:hypothetical protein